MHAHVGEHLSLQSDVNKYFIFFLGRPFRRLASMMMTIVFKNFASYGSGWDGPDTTESLCGAGGGGKEGDRGFRGDDKTTTNPNESQLFHLVLDRNARDDDQLANAPEMLQKKP